MRVEGGDHLGGPLLHETLLVFPEPLYGRLTAQPSSTL
jgi:hypothetical protein